MDTEEFEDYIFFYGVGDDMCRTHAFISLRSHSDECVKFTNISHEPNFEHQAIGRNHRSESSNDLFSARSKIEVLRCQLPEAN